MDSAVRTLFKQVDASALAVFRMGMGALLLFDCINYGLFLCIKCDYVNTEFLFKYAGFEWVHALPEAGLRFVWMVMALCAIAIIVGYYYHFAMVLFTIGFSYHFLLDQAQYLNHFYMVILFCVLMCFIPANRYWSVDAALDPRRASATTPYWTYVLLGTQLEIILIHAGLVKINYDWLNLEPLRLWLNYRSVDENWLLQFLTMDWGIAIASYGAIALHLIGAPLLLFKRTRLIVLGIYASFHLTNAFVFNIGIFPWFTLFASLLLFDKDWPKQVWSWMRSRSRRLHQRYPIEPVRQMPQFFKAELTSAHYLVVTLMCCWLAVQVFYPLRHWTRDGNVAWNEDGHRFSWRMKLRSKRALATFHVRDGSGREWVEKPGTRLNPRQARKMSCIPDMIWQYAGFLKAEYTAQGYSDITVTADIMCSLNARPPARLVRQDMDLTSFGRYEPVTNWTLPMTTPLPKAWFKPLQWN